MDKTTTKILFSIDKFVNVEEVLQAATNVAKRSLVSLHYIQTDDSISLGNSEDVQKDFKMKYNLDLEITKESGNFWKALNKAAEKFSATLVVAGAEVTKSGLLGGGMIGKVAGFSCPVLYLNKNSKWETPNDIVMPLDSNSETRQKFFHVAHYAKLFYATVNVLGVKRSATGEDAKMSHIYAVQGHNYMVERGLRTTVTESDATSDIVSVCLNFASNYRSKWISVLNNAEGILKVSAFQKICEEANCPLLIVPYKEPVGLGGSGY